MFMKAASMAVTTTAAGSEDTFRFAGTAALSSLRYAMIGVVCLRKHRLTEAAAERDRLSTITLVWCVTASHACTLLTLVTTMTLTRFYLITSAATHLPSNEYS